MMNWRARLAVVLSCVMILCALVHSSAVHSGAFAFAKEKLMHARVVTARIGRVDSVRIPWFAPYKATYSTAGNFVHIVAEVSGERGAVRVDLRLEGSDGTWQVRSAMINNQRVSID